MASSRSLLESRLGWRQPRWYSFSLSAGQRPVSSKKRCTSQLIHPTPLSELNSGRGCRCQGLALFCGWQSLDRYSQHIQEAGWLRVRSSKLPRRTKVQSFDGWHIKEAGWLLNMSAVDLYILLSNRSGQRSICVWSRQFRST